MTREWSEGLIATPVLLPTEVEVWKGKPDPKGIRILFLESLFCLMCGGAAFFSCFLSTALFFEAMRLKRAFYLITSERICIQSGWLNKSMYTMDLINFGMDTS